MTASNRLVVSDREHSKLIYFLVGPDAARARSSASKDLDRMKQLTLLLNLHARAIGVDLIVGQSDFERELVEWLYEAVEKGANAVILDAGTFANTSISIRDAVAAVSVPVIELHASQLGLGQASAPGTLPPLSAADGRHILNTYRYVLALHAAVSATHHQR